VGQRPGIFRAPALPPRGITTLRLVSQPQVIECAGKLRNGLYIRSITLYDDRVSFEVYASRALGVDELGSLRLQDSVGTEYERIDPDQVLEGQGAIVFRPALPSGANLHLSQPGWGLRTSR
jgi:hypothetical protein